MDSLMFHILSFSAHVLFNVLVLFLFNSIDSLSFHTSLTGNVSCCEEWQEAQQEQRRTHGGAKATGGMTRGGVKESGGAASNGVNATGGAARGGIEAVEDAARGGARAS